MSNVSHLHRADHPAWHQEPDYNPEVATHLATAYATIQQVPDRTARFREAGGQVVALGELPLCRQQRLNVCYLLGMAHAVNNAYAEALVWLDRAVALARALHDQSALAELLFLRGPVNQRLNRYADALDDYGLALDLHRALHRGQPVVDHAQELHLLVVAAAYAATQERYSLVRHMLSAARGAARHVPMAPGTAAVHDWVWAAYLDARGRRERALQLALRAVEQATAAQDGSGRNTNEPYVVVRICAFAARVATDLAATHADESLGRITHLDMATRCLRAARRALAPADRAGRGHLAMRQARIDALRHREAKALERIEAAERLARELDDPMLLIQALTVHGHILAQCRESWEAALRTYREARVIAAERGVPGGAVQAKHALRRLEEQLPNEEVH
jgi:tetratricopeptide (TPR) repeat protein